MVSTPHMCGFDFIKSSFLSQICFEMSSFDFTNKEKLKKKCIVDVEKYAVPASF